MQNKPATTASAAPSPASSEADGADGSLTGEMVEIHGLAAKPELNGQLAEAGRWLPDRQRYDLRVGGATLAIRPANLRCIPGGRRPAASEPVAQAGFKKGFLGGGGGGESGVGEASGSGGASGSIPLVRGDGQGGKSSLKLPEVQAHHSPR